MYKRCVTCHLDKLLVEFNRRASAADGLQARCRSCARTWYVRNRDEHMRNTARRTREVRKEHHRRLGEYLRDHPCDDCGETDVRCLEFGHEDPSTKSADVTRLVSSGVAWERVLAEIDKCSVRCAKCHRRRTAGMQGSWREAFHHAQAWAGAADRLATILPRLR